VLALTVSKPGARLVYSSSEHHPLERHLYQLDPETRVSRRLTSASGSYRAFLAPGGGHVAALHSRYMTPPELVLIDCGEPARERRVTSSPLPSFERVQRLDPEYHTFTAGSDGQVLHAFVVKPSHFDTSRRYPAVLSCVYAGIAKNRWISYDLLDYFMAERMGYVVVRVDFRASSGHGRGFRYGYFQRMGIIDAEEAVVVARQLRTLEYIDGERIGIWGSSYGGFLTLMTLLTHPGEFNTGVAWKPVTDWRNYTDDYTAQRLGRPQDHPGVYNATSPIHHVDGLEDNLLIIHGMADDNVLFQDTVQLVQKLLEAGKDFDVMFYPRADHGLTYWQENRLDLMRRTARFFRQHMGLGPVPW
jgi:dipeptidyl-peptidase-4